MRKILERKLTSIFIVAALLISGISVMGNYHGKAELANDGVETYVIFGEVKDKFGVPVDTAIVVAIDEDNGNATWVYAENGSYELNLADINGTVNIGDTIKLVCSNGICISNYTFVLTEPNPLRVDFVLDPEEPTPPEIGNLFNPEKPFEHNSSSPEMIMPEFKPDLIIAELSFSNDRPVQGDTVTLTATVTTTGLFVESFDVTFYLDQKDTQYYIASKTVTPSPLEITTEVSVIWHTTDVIGHHTIIAVVDAENKIDELNETNNELSKEICILTVEFCINSTMTQINQLESYVSSLLSSVDAKKINNHLNKTIDELDDALEEYNKDVRKLKDVIKNLHHAVDECWKSVEETNKLWDKNKLTDENAKYIINTACEIISLILETSYVALRVTTAKDITKVENIIVETRVRYIFEKLSEDCKKVDEKLANSFQHYQKAMEALAEEKSIQEETEQGYDKLLKAKEDIVDLVKKGKIIIEFGNWLIDHINDTILVFPPNLKMTPYDIVIQEPIAKGYKTEITITVRNIGVVSARDVKVEIYQMSASTLISSFTIPKIEAGDTVTKTVDWTPTTDGTHDIKVVLDSENKIVEPVKQDNVISSGIYILSEDARIGKGDWIVDTYEEHSNENLSWEGNIIITSTGYLKLNDIDLSIYCPTQDGQYSLTVQQGGRLDVLNGSLVTASTEYPYYKFLCYGKLNIRNASTAQWMWGNTSKSALPGGIQLFSTSECLIENSTIRKGETHNIYCDGASPRIINSTISYAGIEDGKGNGIYCVNGSAPIIEGCLVENSKQAGITTKDSYMFLEHSEIGKNNLYGVYLDNSSATIIHTNVTNNRIKISEEEYFGYGVYCDGGSPVIRNNNITYQISELNPKGNRIPYTGAAIYAVNASPIIKDNFYIKYDEAGEILDIGGIFHNEFGIILKNCTDVVIEHNMLCYTVLDGISIENAKNVTMRNNDIFANTVYKWTDIWGNVHYNNLSETVSFWNSSNIFVRNNSIHNNYGGGGLWIGNSVVTIINNTISKNWDPYCSPHPVGVRGTPGIACYTLFGNNTEAFISNNTISGNTVGISCHQENTHGIIINNTIVKNEWFTEGGWWGGVGIQITSGASGEIINNTLTENYLCGVIVYKYSFAYISHNNITSNSNLGGIYCWVHATVTITNNNFWNNTCAVAFEDGCTGVFQNNVIDGGGISVAYGCNVDTLNNTIISCSSYAGVYYISSAGLIGNNTITKIYFPGPPYGSGVVCRQSSPKIINNTISENGCGIYFTDYSIPEIKHNIISLNKYGILSDTSGGGIIMHNKITENEYGINSTVGSLTITENLITSNTLGGISVTNMMSSIENNTISQNGMYGIYAYESAPIIKNNILQEHNVGIHLSKWNESLENENITGGNNSYAVICCSANDFSGYPDADGFPAQGLQAYYTLRKIGYNDSNIVFMLYHTNDSFIDIDGDGENDLDGIDTNGDGIDDMFPEIDVENDDVTKARLQYELQKLAENLTKEDNLLIYLVNHGYQWGGQPVFCFESKKDVVDPWDRYLPPYDMTPMGIEGLDPWLDEFNCSEMYIFSDMCVSGSFGDMLFESAPVGQSRICVSATADNLLGWYWAEANATQDNNFAGSFFFHPFWEKINMGCSIEDSYIYGCSFIPDPSGNGQTQFEERSVREIQNPQIRPNLQAIIIENDMNDILDNDYGILCNCSVPAIKWNNIHENEYGIYSTNSNSTILNNSVNGNSYGIYYRDSNEGKIAGNSIMGHSHYKTLTITHDMILYQAYGWGIFCQDASPMIKDDNFIARNLQGIISNNSSPSIVNNIIRDHNGRYPFFTARDRFTGRMVTRYIWRGGGIVEDNSMVDIRSNDFIMNRIDISAHYSAGTIESNNVLGEVWPTEPFEVIVSTPVGIMGIESQLNITGTVIAERGKGMSFLGSKVSVTNCTLVENVSIAFVLNDYSLVECLNTDFNKSKVQFMDDYSVLNVSWYLEIYTAWFILFPDGTVSLPMPLGGATIEIWNKSHNIVVNHTNDENVSICSFVIQEYSQNISIKTLYTPHLVRGSKEGLQPAEQYVSMDCSKGIMLMLVLVATDGAIP